MDEAGWGLRHISNAVVFLATHVMNENALDADIAERTAFFRLPRVNSSERESLSSAGSSAATAEGDSTN